jgi:ankyrin repeat protein
MPSQEGQCNVVQVLLEASANVNQATNDGMSPLFMASQEGHCDVVRLLLEASANVNQADTGASPLFIASQNGHCDVVQFLLSANANANAITDFGASPLMVSSHCGHKPIVRLLLEHHAEPNTRNPQYDSFTALHFAVAAGHRSIANLIAKLTALGTGELAELSGEGMSIELRAKLKLRQCAGCERLQLLGEAKFKRCAGCGSVAYCARACQVKHRKEGHKAECRKDAAGAST